MEKELYKDGEVAVKIEKEDIVISYKGKGGEVMVKVDGEYLIKKIADAIPGKIDDAILGVVLQALKG